jgi:hypothetical protein
MKTQEAEAVVMESTLFEPYPSDVKRAAEGGAA